MSINSIEDIIDHTHMLPMDVIQDVKNRITDWVASGGSLEDNYIKQQFRYVENVVNKISSNKIK